MLLTAAVARPLLEIRILAQRCRQGYEAILLHDVAVHPDGRNGGGGEEKTKDDGQGRKK